MAPKSLVLLAAALLLAAAAGQVRGSVLPPLATTVIGVVSGVVPCSTGSNIIVTAVPPFANATVQVVCGSTVVASATTGATGAFNINLGPILSLPATVLNSLLGGQCTVVVATPLVACDVSLAGVTGPLTAPLKLVSSTTGGVIATTTTIFGFIVTTINGVVSLLPGLFSIA